jgi:hypothetical protein
MAAADDAKNLKGMRSFDFFVDMKRTPGDSDLPSTWNDGQKQRFKAAVAYEQERTNAKSIEESMAEALRAGGNLKTEQYKDKSGTDILEVIPNAIQR